VLFHSGTGNVQQCELVHCLSDKMFVFLPRDRCVGLVSGGMLHVAVR